MRHDQTLTEKLSEMLSEDVFHHGRLPLWIAPLLDGYIIFVSRLRRLIVHQRSLRVVHGV